MSLLGRLLSGAGGASTTTTTNGTKNVNAHGNALDSSLEDQFTYNLLFPNAEALCHHDQVFPLASSTVLTPAAAVNSFDLNGDIDLEMRDVRVIIMQEATLSSGSPYLLYDSHAPPPQQQQPPPAPSPALDRQPPSPGPAHSRAEGGRRSISSPRKISVGQPARPLIIQQEATAPRAFGAFDRRPAHAKTLCSTETDSQRSAREYREEVTTFSNCIFGNSEVLAYKGTGTKVHILPSESRSTTTSNSYAADGSLGRATMARSSRLAQSFTSSGNVPGSTSAGFMSPSLSSRGVDRKKVLITRMFPVPLLNEETERTSRTRTPTGLGVDHEQGYPFPSVGADGAKRKPQPKQKRTPMYAVGLVIHLPPASYIPPPTSRSSFRGPGSYNNQESVPSSFNSARQAGWTMLGHGFGVESLESSYSSDIDDRIDTITHHWDIIMRTLSHLQAVATASLRPILKQADISSPDPRRDSVSHGRAPSASISISGKRVAEEDVKPFKIPKTTVKVVQLTANCLMQIPRIHEEVDSSRQRILSGIKATRVVTGQGRWGIWREEARLVNKWAGGKVEGFFFFNLLTAFLGNHTEWLQALGPSWYRRRHQQQQRANKDDDICLPARTIIVSDNKLMARRLIFLLAAFLPANQPLGSSRFHRPSTSTSFGGYSQSPPTTHTVPILREESLRRRMNKRGPASRSAHTRAMSFPAQSSQALPPVMPLDIHHDRRTSDAPPSAIKTANLPIPGSDIGTRKSSTATTSTATPVTTMPHFSTRRPTGGTGPAARPGSSSSLATDDLLRSLNRVDSSGQYNTGSTDSQGNSRWGSMISGFWSSKRRDSSASTTNVDPLSIEDLEIKDSLQTLNNSSPRKGKLSEMVDEAVHISQHKLKDHQDREQRKSESGSATTAKPEDEQAEETPGHILQAAKRTPNPSGAYESPVKTSINEEDGVIDIDVPLPEYLAFETAVSSPSSSGYLSTPGFGNGMDGFENYSRSAEVEPILNVGGWLHRYNPDFALQAVSVQPDLVDQIKESMRAEPTPILSSTPNADTRRGERWVDISSAIVADTTGFTIKHILYRRLVKFKNVDHPPPSVPHSIDSRYGNVYAAAQLTPSLDVHDGFLEERFIEEPIISLDETLVEAVERIIAQSGQCSKTTSACSSRSASLRGAGRERSNSDVKVNVKGTGIAVPEGRLEVPRNECRRMVLKALEEIVRDVVEGRRLGGGGGHEVEDARDRGLAREESFLREGVRNWLRGVEGMD